MEHVVRPPAASSRSQRQHRPRPLARFALSFLSPALRPLFVLFVLRALTACSRLTRSTLPFAMRNCMSMPGTAHCNTLPRAHISRVSARLLARPTCRRPLQLATGRAHIFPIQYNTIQYIHIAKLAMLTAVQDIHRVPRAPPSTIQTIQDKSTRR